MVAALVAGTAYAEGDLAWRAERLEPLAIDAADGFSRSSYELETGKYYRWRIESDGRDEYRLLAPELFRESWIDRVSIDELEVEPAGLNAIRFEDEGEIDIWFVPIRPGNYPFFVEGLERDGFRGSFVVK